jgi:flagellar biosynthesis regulator FlaF
MNKAICLECGKEFYQERDLQICDDCIDLFDTAKLWKDHDNNLIDALDFNENVTIRERYRIGEF